MSEGLETTKKQKESALNIVDACRFFEEKTALK
jgi:hypothetical protein